MASRKWWSKRKWPTTANSDASSNSSRTTTSSKRGRFTTQKLQAPSQRRSRQPRPSPSAVSSESGFGGRQAPLPSRPRARPNLLAADSVSQARPLVDEAAEELEDDSLNEVVLALDVKGRAGGRSTSQLGACYYIAREEKLYFMLDLQSGGLEAVETVRLHAQPTVILLPSRVDEEVDKILDPREDDDSRSTPLPYVLDIRPSSEFDYEGGKRKLIELQLPSISETSIHLVVPGHEESYERYVQGLDPGFTGRQGRLLALSTMVDLESILSMGCVSALLGYLQRRRAAMYLPGDREAERCMRVSHVEIATLKGYMMVTTDTLSALQIVQSQSHPSAQNQGPKSTGSKEDLSIYGIFHRLARTPQGRSLLRQFLLRPSLDLEVIHERHATISTFLGPDNESKMDEMVKSLNQITNMRLAMLHLHKGMSGVSRGGGIKNGVWMLLRSFAFYALAIRTASSEIGSSRRLLILIKIVEQFQVHELATIGRLVTDIIDFQRSQQQHRTVVKAGVDDELDELKRTYDGLEDLLGETSRAIAATIPHQFAIELTVVFLPQIGFLICMPKDPDTRRAVWEGGPDEGAWERIFTTEEHVYYKDYRMQEMDERIGDLHAAICDKEIEIVHELAQRVLEYEDMLCTVSDICGELDALLVLAQGARLYKLARPRMTADNVIEIHDGRHLLQEQTVPACIPNDAQLVGGEGEEPSTPNMNQETGAMLPPPRPSVPTNGPSMLVLTGPNYSGKSVYLKQVALIVYLAHVGSFVPAMGATIGLTDRILTRIATRESVTRPHSAFAIDLQQVSTALRTATRQSLLLLDEFGKGTAASDGAGLLCGTLEHLLARPRHEHAKVLVATHFHELFECSAPGGDVDSTVDESSSVVSGDQPRPLRSSFLPARPGLAFAHMEVLINQSAAEATDQVTYLYKLQPGRSLASLGMVCAALNGIDAAVVARAEDLVVLEASGEDLVAACAGTGESREEREELEGAERVARRFLAAELGPGTEQRDTTGDEMGENWRALLEELV